jgi:fumarylacetoacetase
MALKSWVASAHKPGCDFPIENLPYGVFRHQDGPHIGVAIGESILDLHECARSELFDGLPEEIRGACREGLLNPMMALGPAAWAALRARITEILDGDQADAETRSRAQRVLVDMGEATMELPVQIGDYTDFYASIHHATRVGKLFRPDNPLLPNYKYVPIGYHGRASSVVLSGSDIRRPCGQIKDGASDPIFAPAQRLDYELEVGAFVGVGNTLGTPIPIDEAEQHIFGLCLMNDWSARDIQAWEYQPLGPFLAKSFATTISPWIVPMEALAPYRVAATRPAEDPAPLGYLRGSGKVGGAIDLTLEVYLQSRQMRKNSEAAVQLSQANLRDLYWTLAQLLTHHASNGCNLRPGDLFATGTISGPAEGSEGCLLEMRHHAEPIRLPGGELRTFLEDGDQVTFRAYTQVPGLPRIGFGECTGMITAALRCG